MQPSPRFQFAQEAFGDRAVRTVRRNATAIAVGAGLLSLVTLAADRAQAQVTFSGFDPGQVYDVGLNPSVTIYNGTVVEVHNLTARVGELWYRVGTVNGSTISWNAPHQYDTGFNPSVAMTGTTVIEVHNGGSGPGPLWYRVGTVDGSTISWSNSQKYDEHGFNPSIAVAGSTVVEVHNGGAGTGPLWYRMGNVNGTSVSWNDSHQFDSFSTNPSVAAYPCVATPVSTPPVVMTCVLEVHNSNNAPGPLWYRQGQSNNGSTISWQAPAIYDAGWNPKISSSFDGVLEVHNGQAGVGPLSYHSGATHNVAGALQSPAIQYDSGNNPSVAIGSTAPLGCTTAIEVHNGGADPGPVWYHVGPYKCPVVLNRH